MIILDTHLWIWLADENEQLTKRHRDIIEEERSSGLGVSAASYSRLTEKYCNTRT